MQIALVHNERAGDKAHSTADLLQLFRGFGYRADSYGRDAKSLQRALTSRPDVVAVSGGDGTVARVAIALCGSETPMFVLPTGTANNIATSVGVSLDDVSHLAGQLSRARRRRLDVCRIVGNGSETHFVEAAGIGVIGTMLDRESRRMNELWRRMRGLLDRNADHWDSTAQYVAQLLRDESPRRIGICADGHDLSGEYVTVEVMNIRAIGPRVVLAPSADPGDGWLDLVLVTRADQNAIADDIASRTTRTLGEIPPRRVRDVEIEWPDEATHADDEIWPDATTTGRSNRASIHVSGAVNLLVPD